MKCSSLRSVMTVLWIVAGSMSAPHARAQSVTPRDSSALVQAADSVGVDTLLTDSTALHRASEALTAQAETSTPETLAAVPPSVPVFLGGKEIFRVRASRDGLSPSERAKAIRSRLTSAVADDQVPADSVRLITTPDGVEVRLGKYFLWVITPLDVDGIAPTELATQMVELPELVRSGVERERAGRRPLGILISVMLALGLTLAAITLWRLLRAASVRWRTLLREQLPKYLGGIRIRDFEVLSQSQVVGVVGGVLARADAVVGVVLVYLYLTLLFSLFPWTQGWSWQLLNFAGTQLGEAVRSVGSAVPGLMMIAVIVVITHWLTRLLDRFFDSIAAGTHQMPGFHPELARPSKRLLRILLWLAAIVIGFPFFPGAQSKAFQGVSLFLGVLVSLGSTGVVGNIIAGLVLTYSRSFKTGDRVRIGDQTGDVVSLGFFATKLRTIRNEEVTLPNGQVASSAIVNYTRLAEDPGLVLHTQITIGYDVEWRQVHALLIAAALSVEGVEKSPEPKVFQRSLDDYYVAYELTCVTHLSHPQLRLYSDLHAAIQDEFNRAGVEILSPAYHAIRDANAIVLPAEPKGPRAEPGAFRIRTS